MDENTLSLAQLLLARLERISADSVWAHRASGIRGSLVRMLDEIEKGVPIEEPEINREMEIGFSILAKAAEEISE
jgi:hypothetical protein